jgi:hypothetical protein
MWHGMRFQDDAPAWLCSGRLRRVFLRARCWSMRLTLHEPQCRSR